MATPQKKIARRILKRVNGVLTVVYVDAQTGQVITNLDGYTLESADGFGTPSQPNTTPSQPTPEEEPAKPSRPSNEGYDQGHKDWLAKRVPDDDSNPFDEMDKQGAVIKGGFDNVRNTLVDGITGLGARIFGEGIGKGIGEDIGTDIRENGVPGAGDAVRNVGAKVSEVAGNVGGMFGGIFGGSGESGPPVSPNEMFTYRDIGIRKLPVSEDYMTNMAAAAYAVDPNIRFEISSAGQPPTGVEGKDRTGSHRHDVDENGLGQTADLMVYVNGEQQTPNNNPELFEALVQSAATMGFTGIGVSPYSHFIHVGGGTPAVWSYDSKGNDIPAPENIRKAYEIGWQQNAAGKGSQLLAAYTDATKAPEAVQTAAVGSKVKGVNPNLVAAVEARKAASKAIPAQITQVGSAPAQPGVIDPTASLGDQIAMAPIQGGKQQAPLFDARFDPVTQTTRMLPEQEMVSSQGLEMGPINTTKIADAGFVPSLPSPAVTQDINEQEGQRYLDALLSTLNEAEGSPKANELFGFGQFDDFSTHPNTKIAYNEGKDFSTAAGLFQINKPTFDEFAPKAGVTDFSEESQWAIARKIAMDEYAKDTGRNLMADLATGNKQYLEQAYNSLANRWASLPTGQQSNSKMKDLVTSYETHSAFKPSAVKSSEPAKPVTSPKMDSEPVTASGVTSKINRPASSSTTSNGGFMGTPTKDKNPVTRPSSSSETVSQDVLVPSKISSGGNTNSSTQKTQQSSGFVPRPTTPSTPSPKINNTPTKDKSAYNQTTQTNAKIDSSNKDKSKGKN